MLVKKYLLVFSIWVPTTLATIICASLLLISFSTDTKIINKNKNTNENAEVNEYQLYAALPEKGKQISADIRSADARPEILNNFFKTHNSPLNSLGQFFVDLADEHNLDFRLLPAIAMQESNLCKKIPEDSHNCWGYGVYGDNVIRFASFEEGATTVAENIRARYIDKGYLSTEEIMSKYTPSSNGSWANAVRFFMAKME